MIDISQVVTEVQVRQAQELFIEYFNFLRTDVDNYLDDLNDAPPLSGYETEIAELPGKYAPPDGRLLLALCDSEAAGCVALYKLDEGICEIKRLWTRPQFRGKKIGRMLIEMLINEACKIGYKTMLLSTVDKLKEAQLLYRSVGFEVTTPYFDLPDEMMVHEVFMKLGLE